MPSACSAGADITAQGGTLVDAGATLQMQADLEAEPIVLNGHGVSPGLNGHNVGARLRNISGDNTYTGTLTLGSSATIGVDSGSQRLHDRAAPRASGTGTITAADLTKELTGTLVLAEDNAGFGGPRRSTRAHPRRARRGTRHGRARHAGHRRRPDPARTPPAPTPTSPSSSTSP